MATEQKVFFEILPHIQNAVVVAFSQEQRNIQRLVTNYYRKRINQLRGWNLIKI